MAFQNLAKDKKICIGQMIQFPDNGTATAESSNEVVSAMLKKPTANTIIMFASTQYINVLYLGMYQSLLCPLTLETKLLHL
jgi:hypothetical protein